MDVKLPYKKSSDSKTAYENVKKKITPKTLEQFKVKSELHYNDKDCVIQATGTGFKLNVFFKENEAQMGLELSFLLKPLKNKILGILTSQFQDVL